MGPIEIDRRSPGPTGKDKGKKPTGPIEIDRRSAEPTALPEIDRRSIGHTKEVHGKATEPI